MAEEAVAVQQGLAGLTRTMSMHMDRMNRSTTSFKEAAAQHNKNVSNVVKDVFGAISGQRREMAETNENIEEAFSGIRQGFQNNTRATESVNEAMQQVLSVQYKTLGELSQLNRAMNFLVSNTSGGALGQVFGGALTNIFGSGFSNLTNALKLILPAGIAGGAAYMSGQSGIQGGALGPGVGESGSSTEAMSFFQSKGWSKEQSAGIVGNLQAESGKNLRTNAVGDSGLAYGIAQWHPDRQAKFQQIMGIPIRQSNFKQQLEFVDWELKNTEAKAGNILRSAQSAEQAASLLDQYYERSTGAHRSERMSNARALMGAKGSVTPTTPVSPSITNMTTPGSSTTNVSNNTTNISQPLDPGRQAPVGAPGVTGPASSEGQLHTKSGTDTQHLQPDIVSKFKNIQSQAGMGLTVTSGFRDPQHNADVGGAKNSAHTRGNAVDVTFPGGIQETVKMIEVASAAGIGGIGVYRPGVLHFDTEGKRAWGPDYHSKSIPEWALPSINKHLEGKTPSSGAGEITPSSAPGTQTPINMPSQGATDVGQQTSEYRPENFMSYAQEQLMSEAAATSSIMGGMGGTSFPTAALGSVMGGMSFPAAAIESVPQVADMLQAAAIEDRVIQSMQLKPPEIENRETEPSQFMQSPERHYPQGSYSEYNTDNHLYPEWPSMILGHYHEGDKIMTSSRHR